MHHNSPIPATHRTVYEPLYSYGSFNTNLCVKSIKTKSPMVKWNRKLNPLALKHSETLFNPHATSYGISST